MQKPPPPTADTPAPWYDRAAAPLLWTAVALALLAHLRIDGGLIDDAYITYRYAANLAEGRGMLYNPGERVLGTTTPGWAALLGAAGAVLGTSAIPAAARILGGLLLAAAGLVAARLGRRLTGSRLAGAFAGALVVLGPYDLVSGVAGMEAPLFNLLVMAALLGLAEGRWVLAAAAAGLAPVVRPEGALIVAVVGAAWMLSLRPRRPDSTVPGSAGDLFAEAPGGSGAAARTRGATAGARLAIVPALLLLPGALLLAAVAAWYGSPVPQSVRAKQAGIYPLTTTESALETLRALRGALTGAGLLDVVPGVYLLGLAAGTVWLLRRSLRLWPIPVLLWVLLAFYATSRTTIFPHYVALMEPFALVAWGAALYGLLEWGMRRVERVGEPPPERVGARAAERVGKRVPAGDTATHGGTTTPEEPPARRDRRAVLVAVVGAVLLVRPLALYPLESVLRGEPSPADAVVGLPMMRMAFYRVAAEVVGPAIPPGTTVLMPEIGELGFRLPHVRVLDAAGLVSPEAVEHLPVPPEERVGSGVGAIPAGLVRAEEPELVMTLELFARRSVYEDAWFADNYETVWLWNAEDLVWGPLRIHARKGSAVGERLRGLTGGVAGD